MSLWHKHCLSPGHTEHGISSGRAVLPPVGLTPPPSAPSLLGAGEQSRPAVGVAWNMTSSGCFLPGPHSSGGFVPAWLLTPCVPFTHLLIPPNRLAPGSGSSGRCSRDRPDL